MHKRIRSIETALLLIERLVVQASKVVGKIGEIDSGREDVLGREDVSHYRRGEGKATRLGEEN
jgi:hypothetical protein